MSCLQGDIGSAGPPGPIGETGHGLPGPKVNNTKNIYETYCSHQHDVVDLHH